MKTILTLLSIVLSVTYNNAMASQSVSFLSGNDFKVGEDKTRNEMTYENAALTKWGDSFFWLDITAPFQKSENEKTTSMYGEWSPRMLIKKFSKSSFIESIFLANTFEFGNNDFGQSRANLHGIGANLKLSSFLFFQYNFYLRDNLDRKGVTAQSTIAYKMIQNKFIWSAYIDIVHGDEANTKAHYHSAQQLKYNIYSDILAGIEYQYWNTKYGIEDGEIESNFKFMLQFPL